MKDLRQGAAALRARLAPAEPREAPQERGERLATIPRGRDGAEEIRLAWDEYEGRPFLSIRLWTRGSDGRWWPDKARGMSIRIRELADFADGVQKAIERASELAGNGRAP